MRAAALLVTLVACAVSGEPADAAILPAGPADGALLCSGRGGRRVPVAALADGRGGFLAVTRDPFTDMVDPPDGGDDIGLVRLDASLRPVAGADPCGDLLVGGTGHQTPFAAFAIAPGRFVVIARERGLEAGSYARVFAWGFDARGLPIFPDIMVTPADPSHATDFPFGAPDGAGGFFLGWLERAPGAPNTGRVLVHRFDASGRPLWPGPVAVSAGALAVASFSGAVADGTGGVFVTWIEPSSGDPDGYQPRVQHLDAAGSRTMAAGGSRIDPARRIAGPALLAPWRPAVTGDTAGDAVGDVAGVVALALAEVPRAHLILADGARPWGTEGLALTPASAVFRAGTLAFAPAPDGSLRVTWVETDGAVSERLMGRRLDADGGMPWPDPVVLLETDGILERSEAVLADGTLVVTAAVIALDQSTAPSDLVAQAIDARGRLRTGVSGVDLCRSNGSQSNPLLSPAASGTAAVIWSDDREGIGVDGADAYFTQSFTWTSMPRIDPQVATPALAQGRTVVVSLAGDDLQPGLGASAGAGLTVSVIRVNPLRPEGPGDRLTLEVGADANAPTGRHTLRIVNPDGGAAETPWVVDVSLDPRRIDIDGSGRADGYDLVVLASSFGRTATDPGYLPDADIDGSGLVDGLDLALLAARFGDRFLSRRSRRERRWSRRRSRRRCSGCPAAGGNPAARSRRRAGRRRSSARHGRRTCATPPWSESAAAGRTLP